MGFEELLGVNPWTAGFTLLNTIALFIVMKKFLFKPVMDMIQSRQREIDEMYEKADVARQEADALRADYEQKLRDAAKTSEQMVQEAMTRGQNREAEIIQQANREANAIREKAAADIRQEKKKAINEAKNEIAGLAMDIAGKVVGRSLQEADQERLVDQFIEELGGPV